MADTKITALAAITTVAPANDLFAIVDVSDNSMAASGTTKNITTNQILGAGGIAALSSATITGDLTVRTNKLFVNATGVGVNYTSPAVALHVGTTGATNKFCINTAVTNAGDIQLRRGAFIGFSNAADIGNSEYIFANGGALEMGISGSTAMTLNSTGLGVGGSPANFANYTTIHAIGKTTTAGGVFQTSTSNNSTAARFACSSTGVDLFVETNHPIAFYTNATEKMRLDATGNLGIGVTPSAGKGCLQLSSGINFPATQVASSDANTLDDYEEGSWVPTLNSGTFSAASCRYTKVGNMVTVFFDLTVGTGGGSQITNLPFTAASTSTVSSGIYTNNQTYAVGTTAPVAVIGGSSTTLFFRTVGSGVAFSAMSLTAGANLTGSISYFV